MFLFGKPYKQKFSRLIVDGKLDFPTAAKLREDTADKVEEANKKARALHEEMLASELKNVLDRITEAAYSGEQHVFLDSYLHQDNEAYLQSLGYRVVKSNSFFYTRIFWDKDDKNFSN